MPIRWDKILVCINYEFCRRTHENLIYVQSLDFSYPTELVINNRSLKSEPWATDWLNVTGLQGDHITGYRYQSRDKSWHIVTACALGWWDYDIMIFNNVDTCNKFIWNRITVLDFRVLSGDHVFLCPKRRTPLEHLSLYIHIYHISATHGFMLSAIIRPVCRKSFMGLQHTGREQCWIGLSSTID